MKKRCLNHGCTEEWENLGVGDLYSLEIRASKDHRHHTKFFWLCLDCATRFDICLGVSGVITVCPQSIVSICRIPSPKFDLRLVMGGTYDHKASADRTQTIKSPRGADAVEQPMIVSSGLPQVHPPKRVEKRQYRDIVVGANHSLRQAG